MECDSAHFPVIAVTGYQSQAVRCVEKIIGYFVHARHPVSFAYFTVKTKAYNVIISHNFQL